MSCTGYHILGSNADYPVHCPGCAEAASLRDRVDELRTELESHVNADAAWKLQVDALREQLAAAEAERDEIQGNLERATEAFLSWRERAGRAEDAACAVIQSARNDLRSHNAAMDLSAEVLADVRAERDELRGRAAAAKALASKARALLGEFELERRRRQPGRRGRHPASRGTCVSTAEACWKSATTSPHASAPGFAPSSPTLPSPRGRRLH